VLLELAVLLELVGGTEHCGRKTATSALQTAWFCFAAIASQNAR